MGLGILFICLPQSCLPQTETSSVGLLQSSLSRAGLSPVKPVTVEQLCWEGMKLPPANLGYITSQQRSSTLQSTVITALEKQISFTEIICLGQSKTEHKQIKGMYTFQGKERVTLKKLRTQSDIG